MENSRNAKQMGQWTALDNAELQKLASYFWPGRLRYQLSAPELDISRLAIEERKQAIPGRGIVTVFFIVYKPVDGLQMAPKDVGVIPVDVVKWISVKVKGIPGWRYQPSILVECLIRCCRESEYIDFEEIAV